MLPSFCCQRGLLKGHLSLNDPGPSVASAAHRCSSARSLGPETLTRAHVRWLPSTARGCALVAHAERRLFFCANMVCAKPKKTINKSEPLWWHAFFQDLYVWTRKGKTRPVGCAEFASGGHSQLCLFLERSDCYSTVQAGVPPRTRSQSARRSLGSSPQMERIGASTPPCGRRANAERIAQERETSF